MRKIVPFRLDVAGYDALDAAGTFADRRVELLNGLLVMMTTGPAHDNAVTVLGDLLEGLLPKDDWTVREEKPLVLSRHWKPIPDLVVLRGPRARYARRTPDRHDVALVVEVSDTTYPKDSGPKRRAYSRAGIREYWIIDLARRVVEIHIAGAQGLGLHATIAEHGPIPLRLDDIDFEPIPTDELFP
ncbi:hypothetical protein OJF2_43400 [Aquisphaera giovannonii]|uniref:Putative restriction endonuclease domain-containing protein n=1 Tax=Aquisphaera giovannonii TaxID=406548 RepID=A0A5B9W5C6_9BACT|nr:Uma2 family endonuclease [Aquisphaera giovannonii]QEH35783.1 hypothetical protein OJF2_43400 [Aquisphaera giovannonii]